MILTISVVSDSRYVVGTRLIPVMSERRVDGSGARAV